MPRDNDEHRANQRASDPANPALWLLDCFDNDLWLGSEKWEGGYSPVKGSLPKVIKGALPIVDKEIGTALSTLLPAFLERAYREWAAVHGRRAHVATNGELWKQLSALGFVSGKAGGTRSRFVPDADELRARDRLNSLALVTLTTQAQNRRHNPDLRN